MKRTVARVLCGALYFALADLAYSGSSLTHHAMRVVAFIGATCIGEYLRDE